LLRVVAEIIASALERRTHERNLKAAKKAAEAANDAKSQFLANMSHEVRTPLNGILGMTNILLDTSLEAPQRELAETVRQSANALLQIVNDILDFSKIEYGKIDIEKVPFNLLVTLEDLVELMAPTADKKGIDLTLWFGPETPRRLIGDPGRIRQVLLNLVGNALKFTEVGHVLLEVGCVVRNDRRATLELAVHDTGPGIPATKLPLLFRKFTQLDPSATRKHEGTGLGLAISEHLITLMGGRITVQSEAGIGSTFTVHLPLDLDLQAVPPDVPTEELTGVRILVVDEDHLRRTTLVERCTGWGMNVTPADGGYSALDILARAGHDNEPFSLVLLDRRLLDLSCERFVNLARQDTASARVPIILLASIGERGEGARYRQAGFNAYLVNPVRESVLREALTKCLGAAEAGIETGMLTIHSLRESRSTGKEVSPPAAYAGRRALLVEDNLINQKVAAAVLTKMGFAVDVAGDGLEALEAVNRDSYDIIFMDCQMPGMDGLEATRRIRSGSSPARTRPVIAMTAHAMDADRQNCFDAGMDDYLSKPVSLQDLSSVLKRHLA
jgi:CheY-like chemotaxis protein/nitrogen-specific signal transduction histidine kinase